MSAKPRVKVKEGNNDRKKSKPAIDREDEFAWKMLHQPSQVSRRPAKEWSVEVESFLISRGRDCIVLAVECRALVCQV